MFLQTRNLGSGTLNSILKFTPNGLVAGDSSLSEVNGLVTQSVITATTVTADDLYTFKNNSSGTPGANYGTSLLFNLKSSTTNDQNAGKLSFYWTTATHASRTSALGISLVNSAGVLTEFCQFTPTGLNFTTSGATQTLYLVQTTNSNALLKIKGGGGSDWHIISTGSGSGFGGSKLVIQDSAFNTNMVFSGTNVGIGLSNPTAVLHLMAGTATANTAPLKYTSGTLNTTAVAGQREYNGNHYATNVALLRVPIGGTIVDRYADVATTSTNGTEDDLYSDTLLANTFNGNGDKVIESEYITTVASATASRRIKKYVAGTLVFDSGALTLAAGADFRIVTEVIRESSTVLRVSVTVSTTSSSTVPYTTYTRITGLTLSNTQIIKTTGIASGSGAAAGDITNKMAHIEFKPAQ